MIKTFADAATEAVLRGEIPKGFPPELVKRTRNRLVMLNAASRVSDLRIPPSNRLHPLQGDRAGSWSIRVNDQYRITFRFEDGDAYDVRFEDYH